MSHDVKHNIKQSSTWKQGLYILLFSVCYQLAAAILFVIIVFQFVLKLLTGDTNSELRLFSRRLGSYLYQLIQFMSFNSNDKPYPYGKWPEEELDIVDNTKKGKTDVDEVLKNIEQEMDVDGD